MATELAAACLGFGFGSRRFGEVVALVKQGNAASRRVLEKVGLRYQGRVVSFRLGASSCARGAVDKLYSEVRHQT